MREHSTVRRQLGLQSDAKRSGAVQDADQHDDDLFVDGDQRRRERLRAVGAVKPEPADQHVPRLSELMAVRPKKLRGHFAAGIEGETLPRRAAPAWMFALLGFIFGIGFWHIIGFWGFINAIVLPPQRATQTALSSDAPVAAAPAAMPTYQPARPTRARP